MRIIFHLYFSYVISYNISVGSLQVDSKWKTSEIGMSAAARKHFNIYIFEWL